MDNHFHLLVKMIPEYSYTDEDMYMRPGRWIILAKGRPE
jgi:hypothetical protein